jgi:hypothetical protein
MLVALDTSVLQINKLGSEEGQLKSIWFWLISGDWFEQPLSGNLCGIRVHRRAAAGLVVPLGLLILVLGAVAALGAAGPCSLMLRRLPGPMWPLCDNMHGG